MSGAVRAAHEWWDEEWGDGSKGGDDKDDLLAAFVAGWDAAMGAEWVNADGESLGPAHPKAPH